MKNEEDIFNMKVSKGQLELLKETPISQIEENLHSMDVYKPRKQITSHFNHVDDIYHDEIKPVEFKCLDQIADIDQHLNKIKRVHSKKEQSQFKKKMTQSKRESEKKLTNEKKIIDMNPMMANKYQTFM